MPKMLLQQADSLRWSEGGPSEAIITFCRKAKSVMAWSEGSAEAFDEDKDHT